MVRRSRSSPASSSAVTSSSSARDVVPADVRCVKVNDLRVNEMLLTGEPEDVAKSTKVKPRVPGVPEKLTADNMAFSSCNVKAGTAAGIIVATGMRTRVGTIAALLNDADGGENPAEGGAPTEAATPPRRPRRRRRRAAFPTLRHGQSPLQHRFGEHLAVETRHMAIAVCVVVFTVGVALGTKTPRPPTPAAWLFMILESRSLSRSPFPRVPSLRHHPTLHRLLGDGQGERPHAQDCRVETLGSCVHHLHRQDAGTSSMLA